MDWVVIATAAIGGTSGWLTLFVRERAREAAKEEIGTVVSAKLAEFKADFREDLLRSLNGTYRRSAECTLIEGNNERRIGKLEDRVDELHKYAHTSKHDLAGQVQRMIGELERLNDATG